ncbi:MAG: hypothetical protein DME20_12635 [Verrucomicrobia bacterium]|nr:MAG: hypothetical protein DME20_12635 [Verrucomicrobiota bacterium]
MNERRIADDVMLMSFPWRTLGIDFRRNVTLLRLADGRVVVHSTARFTEQDIAAIRRFGEPSWLVEATLMHNTFAKEGRKALPNIPYLAPDGFAKASGVQTDSLLPPPRDCDSEIDVLRIDGVRVNEHALFHRWSRTLVVADLFFSFPEETSGWPRFFLRHVMRLPRLFGISSFYRRLIIRDKLAFERSMNALLNLDFERMIVAHWKSLDTNAKRAVEQVLTKAVIDR